MIDLPMVEFQDPWQVGERDIWAGENPSHDFPDPYISAWLCAAKRSSAEKPLHDTSGPARWHRLKVR